MTGLDKPCDFQESEAPRFQDNRHMKVVRLSAIRTGRLYPQEIFLVLIFFGGKWWRSWLRHCAMNRKVAGLIPGCVIRIFL